MDAVALRNRFRLWRTGEGLTLDEVADLTGLSKSYVSRIERGERQPTPHTKVLIARRLGVEVRDLFEVDQLEGVA